MTQIEQPGSHDGRDILPVYRPSGEGTIVVYAGDLLLAMGADEHVTTGNLELQLSPRPAFFAHVAGSDPWLIMHAFDSEHLTVALPPGASIDPPATARGLPGPPNRRTPRPTSPSRSNAWQSARSDWRSD